MIPDFKTYIGESVWSDIHKRSVGSSVRKEDDVNKMDKEELCDYLKDHYVMLNSPYDIIVDEITDGIGICVYSLKGNRYCYLHLCDFSTNKYVELTDLYNKHMRDLLFGYYSVYEDTDNGNFIISPLKEDDGKITNEFFIEVLDFLLKIADNMHHPCLKKKTSTFESVWSDIHRRSNGEQVRKEDDINQLDYTDFFNYIYCLYWPTEWNDGETVDQFPSPIHDNTLKIQVPLTHIPKPSGVGYIVPPITMCFNGSNGKLFDVILSSKLIDKYPDTEKILGIEYKFEYPQKNLPIPHIVKKNGKMTNNDCIKIIDKILGMVDKPLFKKNS